MLRQVLIPNEGNSTISIPSEFYGMTVEVLVYPFRNNSENASKSIDDIFDKHLFPLNSFKFNRDEANDYE